MKGLADFVALSKDKVFLDALEQKYLKEVGEDGLKIAQQSRQAFEANARDVEVRYEKYFEYYNQIRHEFESAKNSKTATPKSETQASSVSQLDLSQVLAKNTESAVFSK